MVRSGILEHQMQRVAQHGITRTCSNETQARVYTVALPISNNALNESY